MTILIVFALLAYANPATLTKPSTTRPLWHVFENVFGSNGHITNLGCQSQNIQSIYEKSGTLTVSVVVCNYGGTSYQGDPNRDCNVFGLGDAPGFNGTLIPYQGCQLSYAPMTRVFTDIYNVTNIQGRGASAFYDDLTLVASIVPSRAWSTDGCSYLPGDGQYPHGHLVCRYLGVAYESIYPARTCNLGKPLRIQDTVVPQNSCMMQRSE